MDWLPLNVPAFVGAATVTVLVALAFGQPPVPFTVYLIVVVPAATPVMTPVVGFTVAVAVLSELQLPPAVVDENVVVVATQTF